MGYARELGGLGKDTDAGLSSLGSVWDVWIVYRCDFLAAESVEDSSLLQWPCVTPLTLEWSMNHVSYERLRMSIKYLDSCCDINSSKRIS
jgi:hypothetical protein